MLQTGAFDLLGVSSLAVGIAVTAANLTVYVASYSAGSFAYFSDLMESSRLLREALRMEVAVDLESLKRFILSQDETKEVIYSFFFNLLSWYSRIDDVLLG